MRKLLSIFFICIAFFANAYDFIVDGLCYNIDSDNTSAYIVSSNEHSNLTGEVIIPDYVLYNGNTYKVSEISYNAFNGCTGITSLTIGRNISTIRDYAFNGCTGLYKVIWNAENCYCRGPFNKLTNIEVFEFGENVEIIDEYLCEGLSNITEITIPSSVKRIGYAAFQMCSGITNLNLSEGLEEIGKYSFSSCSGIQELYIPNSVDVIDDGAFMMCSAIDTLSIGNNVRVIGRSAFDMCTSLTKIVIPNSVYVIGEGAFWKNSSLKTLVIGEKVASIGETAFSNCSSLQDIISLKKNAVPLPESAVEKVNINPGCVLHVRKGSKMLYERQYIWNQFGSIVEDAEDYVDVGSGSSSNGVYGDVNGDGSVNAADVTAIYNIILGIE